MNTINMPLKAKDLRYAYGSREVLKGISGDFYQGTFYAIAGPNGSGKTTLLKVLAGLYSQRDNKLEIFGESIHRKKAIQIARHISFVPQMFQIPYAYTIREVVEMGRYPYQDKAYFNPSKDKEMVDLALELTGLENLAKRNVNALSGGELQRVMIARAIAQDTDIILLDEPVSHLDIHYQFELIEVLKKLCRTHNKTIITVLHDLNIAMNHCDHLFMLKDGYLVAQGEPKTVLTKSCLQDIYGIDITLGSHDDKAFILF